LSDATHGGYPATQFKSDEMLWRALANSLALATNAQLSTVESNHIYYRALPFNQTFDFKLFDDKGQEVQKTDSGRANSKIAIPPKSRDQITHLQPYDVLCDIRAMFRPDEMFVITNKGIYDLEVRIRVCVPTTNDVPDFAAMTNGYSFFGSKSFGVLTSPPLRVKVIKE
jgi:superfamily II helicase